jgi:hypothetical protein
MSNPRRGRDDSALEAEGMASRLEVALALVAARKSVGLSQAGLARQAGWRPQFVCRLESLDGRLPNLVSVLRYGKTCGLDVGLLFSSPAGNKLTVASAVTLQSTVHPGLFESLVGQTIILG